MKSYSSVQSVERELKHINKRKLSKKSKRDKKPKRHHHSHHHSHHHYNRNRSLSASSDCSDWSEAQSREIAELRQAVRQLKSLPSLRDLSEPIHSLTECLSDSPKELLVGAWSAVGYKELINLTPSSVIEICRHRMVSRSPLIRDRLPDNWPLFPGSELTLDDELKELWSCCLEELERIPPDEVGSIMEGEMDPSSVTWVPMQVKEEKYNLFAAPKQNHETQTVEEAKPAAVRNEVDSTTEKPVKSYGDIQQEILELELRARAIRAMLSKSKC